MEIPILYEDQHLLVCVKPRGVMSQSDSKGRLAMPDLLSAQCGGEIYPVHRLDSEVSGVMAYARTKKAAGGLSQAVSDHERFVKHYLAVVEGAPMPSGIWEDLLFHDRFKNKTYVVDRMRGGVKSAKLSYETLEAVEGGEGAMALVKVRLYTGRSHQIRVQFASRGFPLVGDKKYGARSGGAIGLFSCELCFEHPITKKALRFSAAPSWENPWCLFEKTLASNG